MGKRVAIVFAGAALVAIVVAAIAGLGGSGAPSQRGVVSPQAVVDRAATGAPPPAQSRGAYEVAIVERKTTLRAKPGGHVLARVGPHTEFGSARVVPVLERRSGWLRVMAAERPNGTTAWIAERDTTPARIDYAMRVDISQRQVQVLQGGRVVRRIRTAVGERGTPTPTGTFAVTDKIPFTNPASAYGCCAIALTAHQPDIPSNWPGGDRVAMHATPQAQSIGRPVTHGCMRVPVADARWLMQRLPLGTRVSIRA
jgi:lipoprotein-anchoring transpeptidase ErfK/SrfK